MNVLLILCSLFLNLFAIPIPNGQIGAAEIECGENTIDVVFLTQDVFRGRIFVIGHSDNPKCVSRDVGRKTTSISFDKNECGAVTTRSTDPPGLFVTTKVMISFHEDFITKVDRGYEIQCFYMQADKTVTYPISVSPKSIDALTELAEMPRCRYEVVDPESKKPVEVVAVGSKLLHRWICDSTAPDLWCMTVHSCFVEDGSGTEINILNDQGCAVDRFLLDNLEYGPGELEAQKEAHAFKFADKVVVNFQCSVRLDIKDGECPIPTCEDLSKSEAGKLGRRPRSVNATRSIGVATPLEIPPTLEVDVRSNRIDVLDEDRALRLIPSVSPDCECVSLHQVLLSLPVGLAVLLLVCAVAATLCRREK